MASSLFAYEEITQSDKILNELASVTSTATEAINRVNDIELTVTEINTDFPQLRADVETADQKAEDAQTAADLADAKATEAQQVQARRDFARWYLTDYLHPDDMMAALGVILPGKTRSGSVMLSV